MQTAVFLYIFIIHLFLLYFISKCYGMYGILVIALYVMFYM